MSEQIDVATYYANLRKMEDTVTTLRAEVAALTKERDELVEITADSIIEMASHAVSEKKVELSALLTRAEKAEAALAKVREALEPFAIIGRALQKSSSDKRYLEQPLFYAGTLDDPQGMTLTGRAFDNAACASLTEGEPT